MKIQKTQHIYPVKPLSNDRNNDSKETSSSLPDTYSLNDKSKRISKRIDSKSLIIDKNEGEVKNKIDKELKKDKVMNINKVLKNNRNRRNCWTKQQDELLMKLVKMFKGKNWKKVAEIIKVKF